VSEIKEYLYCAGGQWRPAENKILCDVFRPYDRSVYARTPASGRAAQLAVEAAEDAFATCANEKTFGLVVHVVDTPQQAVEVANQTLDGPTSSISAGNTYCAFELAPTILAGIVKVNPPTMSEEIHATMSGVRDRRWEGPVLTAKMKFQGLLWINSKSGQRQHPI
jgi:acyl-CoA reductase-like NAD-dependent aldehyde dehydrogenase